MRSRADTLETLLIMLVTKEAYETLSLDELPQIYSSDFIKPTISSVYLGPLKGTLNTYLRIRYLVPHWVVYTSLKCVN